MDSTSKLTKRLHSFPTLLCCVDLYAGFWSIVIGWGFDMFESIGGQKITIGNASGSNEMHYLSSATFIAIIMIVLVILSKLEKRKKKVVAMTDTRLGGLLAA